MPIVSIIVPNYNYSRYLRQRLDSLLAQTFSDFELIFLDDASSDNSCALMDNYTDPRITHRVYNQQNSGSTFVQWKRGIELAQGELVWIAESDDFAAPTLLEKLVGAIHDAEKEQAHTTTPSSGSTMCPTTPSSVSTVCPTTPSSVSTACTYEPCAQVAFAFCGSQQVDGEGKPIADDWNHYSDRQTHRYQGADFIRRWLSFRNRVYNASAVVFRREYAQHCIDEVTNMRYAGDWLFWAKMAEKGSVVEVRQELNYFRMHPQKVTAESSVRTAEWLREVAHIYHYLLGTGHYTQPQQTILQGHVLYRILFTPNQRLSDKKNCLQQCCKQWQINGAQASIALVRFLLCKTGLRSHGLHYSQRD